jgi:phosphohistidine phosphatase
VIWFLRHGDAEDSGSDDAARRLTAKGERQSRAAGAALAALGIRIDACISSPKVRSLATARLACEPLGVEPEVSETLRGGDFEPSALAAGRGTVLLVGHEPDFSRAIQTETGGHVELKKGGLAATDGATLLTLLRPGQIKLLAADAGPRE